jgi:hypothetical protein
MPDYCYLHCTAQKLREPERFLMADWVRPEDLVHYEKLGYDSFKLSGRNMPTDALVSRLKAYFQRRYDGNLLDLIQDFGHAGKPGRPAQTLWGRVGNILTWLRYSAPRRLTSVQRLWRLSRKRGFLAAPELPAPVMIDNRALDGFLEPIMAMGGCRNRTCAECRYCHDVAPKAVRVSEGSRQAILADQEPLVRDMESGAFWS